jgi:hypothetical protein
MNFQFFDEDSESFDTSNWYVFVSKVQICFRRRKKKRRINSLGYIYIYIYIYIYVSL